MKSLESENVDVPLGRLLNVAHADGYVVYSFELHRKLNKVYRIAGVENKKAMRGRISLQNHLVQKLIKLPPVFREALGMRTRARVAFRLCGYVSEHDGSA